MDCGFICHQIQKAIQQYQKNNPDLNDTMVVIDIRRPLEQSVEVPKLEYKT